MDGICHARAGITKAAPKYFYPGRSVRFAESRAAVIPGEA
jgi:hypothetical protein